MLTLLYSHCYSAKCWSPQGSILREYWYTSSAGATKYLSRRKYDIWALILLTQFTKCISTPSGWPLLCWNMWGCNSVNKAVLTFFNALIGFLRKIVTSVHGYEQDKFHIGYANDVNCFYFFFNKKCSWIRCEISSTILHQQTHAKGRNFNIHSSFWYFNCFQHWEYWL